MQKPGICAPTQVFKEIKHPVVPALTIAMYGSKSSCPSSRLNLTITGWGKMNYEGYDGDDFHNRADSDDSGLTRVAKLQEGVVPIISRAECGDAKVRLALCRM